MKTIRKTWYNSGGTFLAFFPFLIISSGSASDVVRGSSEVDLVCLPLGARTEAVESK
jgi:hypothetical protein